MLCDVIDVADHFAETGISSADHQEDSVQCQGRSVWCSHQNSCQVRTNVLSAPKLCVFVYIFSVPPWLLNDFLVNLCTCYTVWLCVNLIPPPWVLRDGWPHQNLLPVDGYPPRFGSMNVHCLQTLYLPHSSPASGIQPWLLLGGRFLMHVPHHGWLSCKHW